MNDADLAFLSAAVYEPFDGRFTSRIQERGWAMIRRFDRAGSQAALCLKGGDQALVFRGTEASNFRWGDILSNIGNPQPWAGPGLAHSGYVAHLNRIRFEARRMAEDVPNDQKLWLTGHSMGGVLAVLYAAWVLGGETQYRHRIHGLVTFGTPKGLTRRGCNVIKCDQQRQYVMPMDFAPYHPPGMALCNPGPEVVLPVVNWWPGPISRHSVRDYWKATEKFNKELQDRL